MSVSSSSLEKEKTGISCFQSERGGKGVEGGLILEPQPEPPALAAPLPEIIYILT